MNLLDLMQRNVALCVVCGGDRDAPDHARRCPKSRPPFDGATYDPDQDGARLAQQTLRVWALMQGGRWRTLAEIAAVTGDPEASVSARLRDLRKPRFGGHDVQRRRASAGQWEYRLDPAITETIPF